MMSGAVAKARRRSANTNDNDTQETAVNDEGWCVSPVEVTEEEIIDCMVGLWQEWSHTGKDRTPFNTIMNCGLMGFL